MHLGLHHRNSKFALNYKKKLLKYRLMLLDSYCFTFILDKKLNNF